MTIPTLPAFFDMVYTQENGKLAPDGYLYNDQMFQSLNLAIIMINELIASTIENDGSLTIDALNAPNKTTAEITALEPTSALGAIWFNTTLAKLQVKTAAGTIETITSV